jgi:hypothetical protein
VAVQTIGGAATDQAGQVADTAKDKTTEVAGHATNAAGDVAATAKEQASTVATEAAMRSRQLAAEAQQELGSEADRQTQRLANNVRRLADELSAMASNGSDGTPLPGMLHQLAAKGAAFADYLDGNGAQGLLRDTQNMGRQRPGAFLATAAAAGFAATRIAKHASGSSALGR